MAGIEVTATDSGYSIVTKEDGTPKWIRPVSHELHKELPITETQNIELFDIVEIEDVECCPEFAHSENINYSSLKKVDKIKKTTDYLDELCDNLHAQIFFNKGKAVHKDIFQQSDHSLMFIKVSNCTFYNDESNKLRVNFSYNSNEYNLPVTDPVFIKLISAKGLVSVNSSGSDYYLTISLGEEYNNEWHHKLVAGVISLPQEKLPE